MKWGLDDIMKRLIQNIIGFFYKKKQKNTCITCKFNSEIWAGTCIVGTYYAEKGMSAICYKGELWEKKKGS
jgi:hypothetical protein